VNYFDKNTYDKIRSLEKDVVNHTDLWYDSTYDDFIRILEDNKLEKGQKGYYGPDDFLIASSFAFSWLARIPRVYENDNFRFPNISVYHSEYFNKIDKREFNENNDFKIFTEFVEILDNSVVAVSKMFHFLSPNYFPIIDSKVVSSWNLWFPEHSLPKKISTKKYLFYAKLMRNWSSKTDLSLRSLEKALFKCNEELV
tara:strand:- start:119 stop:712 length:594 start_codon:yes stop_codon:yes gene_type:complete